LVAGFCMMQVMMYAYPAYIAEPGTITPDIEQLLRWASWVLSLPVLLFSAQPFFANAWRDLRQRRISMDLPVALGLLITFGISSVATFEPQGRWGAEVYFDSLTMFVFFLLSGRWLEWRLRERTAGSLDALMQRLPMMVERRCNDGRFERVAARQLRMGDVLRVLPGEAFAADGKLIAGQTQVDESLLSGESRPLHRQSGAAVLAGSYNLQAPVLMQVGSLGQSTRYAQIVALMQQAALDKPRLALLADRVARPFLWIVLALALAVVLAYDDPVRGLLAAAAVLVVTCPCALSLATPSALLASAGWLARQGVLVRRLQALERLTTVDTVLLDKTGTLTQARLGLREITLAPGRSSWSPAQALQAASALAQSSLHPLSRALRAEAQVRWPDEPWLDTQQWGLRDVQEFSGRGLQAEAAGAGWSQAQGLLRLGSAMFCGAAPLEAGEEGLQVFLADAQGPIARFDFDEVLREGAQALLAQLEGAGLQVHLLSGDRQVSVARLAERLGLAERQVHGQCSPQDKLAHLQALQQQGRRVLMVGDGLNDAPVLAQADVSMVVGSAVPLAQAQADVVLPSAALGLILVLREQARRSVRIVRQNLAWAAVYNAVCVPLALMGWLPAWAAGLGMALSSLLVVLNAARLSQPPAWPAQSKR
ncbi:MAG: heavy metal translocating P-type ATPase, partial [Betaproteobacteria bacterium]